MIWNLWNLLELGLLLNIFMNLLLSEPNLYARQLLYSQRNSEGEGSSQHMSCICGEALQEKVAVDPPLVVLED